MAMAARALAAVTGRRAAGLAALSSCRLGVGGGGGARSFSSHSSSAQQQEQVEAALNRKNVDVLFQGGERSATLLPDEAAAALRGVGVGDGSGADDAWVPDQETGVFVPAEEAAANGNNGALHDQQQQPSSSVLDQAVFVREEEMEDVERPAVDMAAATAHNGGPDDK